MRYLKVMVVAVTGLLMLAGIAIALFIAGFDTNAYKPRLQALVQDRLHRKLTLGGDIRLKVFPKVGMALGSITISERDSTTTFATLDEAELSLALMPLIRRQVVVDAVRVRGLHARLVRHADGSTNFDDLRGTGATQPQAAPAGPSKAVDFDVSGIRIEKSGVVWHDEQGGDDSTLEIDHLITGRLADHQSTPVDLQLGVVDSRFATRLDLGLKTQLTLDLGAGQYTLSGLRAHLTGSAKGVTGIDATLSGAIEAQPDLPRVAVSDLKLEAAATQGSLQLQKLRLAVPRLNADLKQQAIDIDHLALSAEGRLASDGFTARLDAPRLQISGSTASGDSIDARFELAGSARAALAVLQLAAVEGSAQAFHIGRLGLTIDAHQGESAIKGTLTSEVSGSLADQVYRIPRLAGAFTVSAPALPGGTTRLPVQLSALLDLKHALFSTDLAAGIEDSHLKAKFEMTPFKKPHYAFDVDLDKLDVDRYLPPADKGKAPAPAPAAAAATDKPVDLSALKGLRLDGKLAIGKLTVSHLQIADLHATVAADNGRASVNPLAVRLYGGSLNGSASADADGNRITLKQVLTGVSLGPLLKDLMGKDPLDGHGNVTLDINTRGATVNALKHGLEGSARLALQDGAINGINLAESFRKAKGMLGGGASGAGDQGADGSQKTDFSELTGSFIIHQGVAHNDDLSAKSPFIRLSGKGDIDIGNSQLDYLAQATLVATATGQGGQEAGNLTGIPVPVRVSGPFAAPKFHLEFAELLKGAAAARVKQQVDQIRQQAGDKLQNAIKDKLPGAPGGKKPDPAEALKGLFR
ncbi:MAG: AsmA family protein [Pseudomonadota bacterium]|nr:AsmA family protein [Pseudomonadota bacterium]